MLDRMDMFATGYNPEGKEDYMAAVMELNSLIGGIHLFGAEPVREALSPLSEELARLGGHIGRLQRDDPEMPYAVAYAAAYRNRRMQLTVAAAELTKAMRADVTREILD